MIGRGPARVLMPGRFVGDEQPRTQDHGACEGDALLFTQGCLLGVPGRSSASPNASMRSSIRSRRSSNAPAIRAGYSTFSWTESSSIKPRCCGNTADLGPSAVAGRLDVPLSGDSQPAATFNRVVLPDPERPTSPTTSPARA